MLSTGTSSCITFCFITPRAQHLQPLVHSLARTLARILAWIPRGHTAKSAYATSKNHSSLTRKGNHVIIDQATVPRAASLDSPLMTTTPLMTTKALLLLVVRSRSTTIPSPSAYRSANSSVGSVFFGPLIPWNLETEFIRHGIVVDIAILTEPTPNQTVGIPGHGTLFGRSSNRVEGRGAR